MATAKRNASVETRRGRPILSLNRKERPSETAQPASEPTEYNAISDHVQGWERWLWSERNAWSIAQHRLPEDAEEWLCGGAWAKRRLSKAEAAELLGLAFAAIDGCGE